MIHNVLPLTGATVDHREQIVVVVFVVFTTINFGNAKDGSWKRCVLDTNKSIRRVEIQFLDDRNYGRPAGRKQRIENNRARLNSFEYYTPESLGWFDVTR